VLGGAKVECDTTGMLLVGIIPRQRTIAVSDNPRPLRGETRATNGPLVGTDGNDKPGKN